MIEIPKASLMQTGLKNFEEIIQLDDCNEGVLTELPDEEFVQTGSNNFKFLDLFWFRDPKSEETGPNRLELVTFCLNLNYGNLRINGYLHVGESLHNNALFLTRNLLTVNAAIYPSSLFHIRNMRNKEKFVPLEQLYVPYDPENEPWQDELAKTEFVKRDDQMWMKISHKEKDYIYLFKDRQYQLFNYALDFVLTKGLTLVGMKK
jgi:hypothetical protein